jgi:16S rRNA (cytosine967-C5)-methyltransferase
MKPRYHGRRHSARSLALQVLLDGLAGNSFVQENLDGAFRACPELSAADRRLTTQLVYTTLRRRGSLDALLRPLVTRPQHEVEPWLWNTLRLGGAQLALLSHIPPHAAIHETVELAAQFGKPSAKGFLNGILRALAGLLTADECTTPAADALPLESGRYRRLARPLLPDPATEPAAYLSAGFSLPRWLTTRWLERLAWDESLRIAVWFITPPSLWLRTNRLKVERAAYLAALASAGIAAEAGPLPQSIRLLDAAAIRDLPGYAAGHFTVQDVSAQQIGAALAPTPGSRVLDLCAAPGGKTTHLAELMANQGEIIACDVDPKRLRTVDDLCRRLGIGIVKTQTLADDPPAGPFDFILVDVPCSNTGVLARRPEVRWRLKPEDIDRLVPQQTKLLIQAAERIRPGGAIVYSTCSIEPIENRQVVDNVLLALPDLSREAELEQAPGQPGDGGYWCRLRRKSL